MPRKNTMPYENTVAGGKALVEAERILKLFGCSNFGTMTDWSRGVLICQFEWSGRRVSIEASWRGYAEAWLRRNPWKPGRHRNRTAYETYARELGERAAPSILRDWIKGQVTAVECGMMPFDHAFMSHLLLPNGQRLLDKALPMLEGPK